MFGGIFGGELIFCPSLNSSLSKIFQGKLFLWSLRINFYVFLGQINFCPSQNKFFWMFAFQGETITLSQQAMGYPGLAEISIINPIRTGGGCFPPPSRFFACNFGSNKATHSKLSDFSQNLTPSKVKVTSFQN